MTWKGFWKTDDNVVHYFVKVTNFSDFFQVPGDFFPKHSSYFFIGSKLAEVVFGWVSLKVSF